MIKPVILIGLIGGTAGTGKSTLAREPCSHLGIDHRLGTGFIREIVKSQFSEYLCPELYRFTFRAEDPVNNLRGQARRLHTAITACIRRAHNKGTSLVIEGNHLIPELYATMEVDLYFVLSAPDGPEHLRRLRGPSHTNRDITLADLDNVRRIDEYLWVETQKYGTPYLPYADNLASFVALLNEKRVGHVIRHHYYYFVKIRGFVSSTTP